MPQESPQGPKVRNLLLPTASFLGTQVCPGSLTSLPTGSHPWDWLLFIIQVFVQVTLPQRGLP